MVDICPAALQSIYVLLTLPFWGWGKNTTLRIFMHSKQSSPTLNQIFKNRLEISKKFVTQKNFPLSLERFSFRFSILNFFNLKLFNPKLFKSFLIQLVKHVLRNSCSEKLIKLFYQDNLKGNISCDNLLPRNEPKQYNMTVLSANISDKQQLGSW